MQILPAGGAPALKPATASYQPDSSREKAIAALLKGSQEPSSPPAQAEEPIQTDNTVEAAPPGVADMTTSPSETPTEPPASEPEKVQEEPIASKYAMLARKEKALRAQHAKFIAEKAAWEAQKGTHSHQQSQQSPSGLTLDEIASDPLGILAKAGLSWDELTKRALNDNPPSAQEVALQRKIAEQDAKLDKLSKLLESQQKSSEEQQTKSYQDAIKQLTFQAKQLVNSDPASYELIKATNSTKDVVELIEKTYKEDGYLLTVDDAAAQVEKYLEEEMVRVAQSKKIQSRLKPQTQATSLQAPQKSPGNSPKQPELKTLSNQVGAPRQLSSRERAILAAEGRLK